jgi:hypothetical protein
MIWAINFFPSVTRRCRRCWIKYVSTLLRFLLPGSFRPTWCTLYSEFWNLLFLGYLPYNIQGLTKNGEKEVLFNKFHRRTNLTLFSNLMFRNKALQYFPYIRLRMGKRKFCSANFIAEQIRRLFCLVVWDPLYCFKIWTFIEILCMPFLVPNETTHSYSNL